MLNVAALAEPTRQRIVEMLAGGDLSSGQIASQFDISAPAISQHLKILKQARLVRVRIEGQHRIYQLDPAGFAELEAWLNHITGFWQGRLYRLESQLRGRTPAKPKRPRKNRSHQ